MQNTHRKAESSKNIKSRSVVVGKIKRRENLKRKHECKDRHAGEA